MPLILLKLRPVSVHRDVTLKLPVLVIDFFRIFLGLQILNILSSSKILSSQAQKAILQTMEQSFPQLMDAKIASTL